MVKDRVNRQWLRIGMVNREKMVNNQVIKKLQVTEEYKTD